jgi:hypothetical protein
MPERAFCEEHQMYLDRRGQCRMCVALAELDGDQCGMSMFGPHEGYEPDGLDEERWENRR